MREDYNLDYWLDLLRKEIVKKLTGTMEESKMVRTHYDMLCHAVNINRRTAERFLRHEERVNATSRKLFAAYALYGKDDLKIQLEPEADYFIDFVKSIKTEKTKTLEQETSATDATNWKGEPKELFMVYEVAFLWHGQEPPAAAFHAIYMTRKMEETKEMLHDAINNKRLKVAKEILFENVGYTRWVSRTDLKAFAESIGIYPDFLFSENK